MYHLWKYRKNSRQDSGATSLFSSSYFFNYNFTDGKVDVDYFYQSLSVTEDYLTDRNKYKCEKCLHYNEAKRSVKFEKLPKLLILQLERFRVRLRLVFVFF